MRGELSISNLSKSIFDGRREVLRRDGENSRLRRVFTISITLKA